MVHVKDKIIKSQNKITNAPDAPLLGITDQPNSTSPNKNENVFPSRPRPSSSIFCLFACLVCLLVGVCVFVFIPFLISVYPSKFSLVPSLCCSAAPTLQPCESGAFAWCIALGMVGFPSAFLLHILSSLASFFCALPCLRQIQGAELAFCFSRCSGAFLGEA